MRCVFASPLTEDQISAAIDGEADPDITTHLERCAFCAARVEQAQHFERALERRLHRVNCPPTQQLVEYDFGLLAPPLRLQLDTHVPSCPDCSAELAEIQAAAHSEAKAQPLRRRPRPSPRERIGEVLAQLLPRPAALALRGTGPRQVTAQAGDTTILLDIQRGIDGNALLRGQLISEDAEQWIGGLVELRQAGVIACVTTIDELGAFSCGPLPAVLTDLRLAPAAGAAIRLQAIDLGAST